MSSATDNVEKETDKVLHKFTELCKHGDRTLSELILQLEGYHRDLTMLTGSEYFVLFR